MKSKYNVLSLLNIFMNMIIQLCYKGTRTFYLKKEVHTHIYSTNTHLGMKVRYVRTLARASSGISLKSEHSGSVMTTLESSPRPPGARVKGQHHESTYTQQHNKTL